MKLLRIGPSGIKRENIRLRQKKTGRILLTGRLYPIRRLGIKGCKQAGVIIVMGPHDRVIERLI